MSEAPPLPNVLLVSPEYPPTPGGVGDYTALLARHLAAEGANVAVLTGGAGDDATEDGVRVLRRVPHWRWGLARRVRDAVRDMNADIVHIQYQTGMYGMHPAVNLLPKTLTLLPPLPLAGEGENLFSIEAQGNAPHLPWFSPSPARGRGGRAGALWAGRVFTTFHDLLPPYLFPKAGPLRDGVTRLLARTSDAAIATNGADAVTLRQWGVRPALVPIGSNIPPTGRGSAEYTPVALRVRFGVPPLAPLLTTFGLLNRSKGLDVVVDALALVRAGGSSAHLLLVGAGAGANDATNRETEAALRSRIEARGMTAHVSRTGELAAEEVAAVLAASDACLLPYRDGASPRRGSLLAALAQGVTVITTPPRLGAYDGLPPLSDDIAVFVPPDDAAALAAAARYAVTDSPDERARRGRAARAYAARFDWGRIARRTLAVYRGDLTPPWAAWVAAEEAGS